MQAGAGASPSKVQQSRTDPSHHPCSASEVGLYCDAIRFAQLFHNAGQFFRIW